MTSIFFSEPEARAHVGETVEALSDFPSVPLGTLGRVVRVRMVESDHWVVRVEWAVPRKRSQYFATVVNVSFNFQTQSHSVTDEFTKNEFDRLVGSVQPLGN